MTNQTVTLRYGQSSVTLPMKGVSSLDMLVENQAVPIVDVLTVLDPAQAAHMGVMATNGIGKLLAGIDLTDKDVALILYGANVAPMLSNRKQH